MKVIEWTHFAEESAFRFQNRLKVLMERGFHEFGDAENRLGYDVGHLGAEQL